MELKSLATLIIKFQLSRSHIKTSMFRHRSSVSFITPVIECDVKTEAICGTLFYATIKCSNKSIVMASVSTNNLKSYRRGRWHYGQCWICQNVIRNIAGTHRPTPLNEFTINGKVLVLLVFITLFNQREKNKWILPRKVSHPPAPTQND